MRSTATVTLADPDATAAFAQRCAAGLQPGLCVWLEGDLGAGKTSFARGLLRGLGWRGAVKSPTYGLVEDYLIQPCPVFELHPVADDTTSSPAGSLTRLTGANATQMAHSSDTVSSLQVYHFDLYRMQTPEEWIDAGFDDLPAKAVRLIEWPDRGGARTPRPDWRIVLAIEGTGRQCLFTICTEAGAAAWRRLGGAE